MVSPDAKDGEIDAPVPSIRHFELSDGLGSAPSDFSMRGIPLCSKCSINQLSKLVLLQHITN